MKLNWNLQRGGVCLRKNPFHGGGMDDLCFGIPHYKTKHTIHWLVIFPVGRVIHLSNNRGHFTRKNTYFYIHWSLQQLQVSMVCH